MKAFLAKQSGRSRLWMGAGALVVAVVVLWGLVYAARAMKESRKQENEASAQKTLARISQALAAYHRKYEGYPDTLARLRGGEEWRPEAAPPERARLLESELAEDDFKRGGYRFRYQPGLGAQRWAATVQLRAGYRLTAEPVEPGGSGEIFYFTDEKGELHAREGEAAGPDDPVVR